jgi:hypothetical protein
MLALASMVAHKISFDFIGFRGWVGVRFGGWVIWFYSLYEQIVTEKNLPSWLSALTLPLTCKPKIDILIK